MQSVPYRHIGGRPGGDHSTFRPHFDRFADTHQVVYVDHRDNGRSDGWDQPQYRSVRLLDGGCGWAGGLGPVAVAEAFDVPADVFAFDDSGVAAMSTHWVEAAGEQDDGVSPAVVSGLRGKKRAPLRWSGERCGGRRRS